VTAFSEPQVGEWYLIAQRDFRVAKQYPEGVEHRWLVVSPQLDVQVRAVLRTTTPGYEGVPHEAHRPGHEPTCMVDRPGTVCVDKPEEIPLHIFRRATYSCREPDGPDREEFLSITRPPRRPKFRRGGSRR
jgi:hypothetical protein